MTSEWPHARIDEIAEDGCLAGGPFGSNLGRKDYVGDGVPVIRGKNIGGSSRFDLHESVFVTREKAMSDLKRNLAIPGDIIVTQRGTLGQVGVVPDGGSDIFVVSQSQMRLRVDESKMDKDFVYFALTSPDAVREMHNRAIASGVPHINLGIFSEMTLPAPGLPDQRRIAWVLGTLDDKIEINRKVVQTLEAAAASIWPRITADLARFKLSEIATQVKDPVQPSSTPQSTFEQFSIPSYDEEQTAEVCEGRSMASGKTRLPDEGAVLLSKLNPETWRAWVAVPSGSGLPVCSPEFVALTAQEEANRWWIAGATLFDRAFRSDVLSHSTGTTGSRQRVKPGDVLGCGIPQPGPEELNAWASLAKPIFEKRAILHRESVSLSSIRNELLPRLVSGKIRVPEGVGPDLDPEESVKELAEV